MVDSSVEDVENKKISESNLDKEMRNIKCTGAEELADDMNAERMADDINKQLKENLLLEHHLENVEAKEKDRIADELERKSCITADSCANQSIAVKENFCYVDSVEVVREEKTEDSSTNESDMGNLCDEVSNGCVNEEKDLLEENILKNNLVKKLLNTENLQSVMEESSNYKTLDETVLGRDGKEPLPDSNLFDPSEMESTPTMRAAMKTFIKPFTAAKKSLPGEKQPNKKTALKTFANKQLNRRLYDASPNDIIKDGSAIYILKKSNPNGSSCEEISDDDTKDALGNSSVLELIHSKTFCTCSKDVPCLFNGESLQQTCEGEDTLDGNVVPCSRQVYKQCVLSPSSKIKFRTFCDIHLWRLKHHHCCPKCGTFCTQGSFLMCERTDRNNDEIHLFHPECYLVPNAGLPPGCPHCCRFSIFDRVKLTLRYKDTDGEDNSKNLTSYFNDYSILMTVVDEAENNSAKLEILRKQELKQVLLAINGEKHQYLRPTGKCLYNPIKNGDIKKVMQLLVNGVNPNHKFKTHKNNTPLHIAAYFGLTGIVHMLLQYGGLIDAVNDDLETPLILAVERKHLAVVRYLIFAGAQIDAKTENGLTAFHVSCKSGCKEIAQFLYDIGNFNINIQDDGGWTPLVWACEYKYLNLVLWLLELGADPNIRDSEENIASHWAACSGESEILDILLDKGCSISYVNKRGDTALHVAARKDNFACVKLLLERGALTDTTNKDGETPFMCCDEGTKSHRILKRFQSYFSEKQASLDHVTFSDISLGLEDYAIQAVNEVNSEEFTVDFRYILKNCQTSDIRIISTVDSVVWCQCKINCGTSACSCSSKCWYDLSGRLVPDFNMADPPIIYECHKLCHCPKTCLNRVVQKGLRIPLQVFRTLNTGWGVRCSRLLPRGTFVCEYIGELIPGSEVSKREDDSYVFDLGSKDFCIDGRFYGNVARFFNHSCEPNLVAVPVFVQHQDQNFPHVALFTSREVPAFAELCFDYGKEFWISKSQTVLCSCGSHLCKYSKDSIDNTLLQMFSQPQKTKEILEETVQDTPSYVE